LTCGQVTIFRVAEPEILCGRGAPYPEDGDRSPFLGLTIFFPQVILMERRLLTMKSKKLEAKPEILKIAT
jgi:hypothetical protein